MRYSAGLVSALALGVMGCSESSPNMCEGVDCDDNNECTYDVCDPATGSCEHFGNCDCVDCNDDNECTDDVCDFTTGMCANQPFDDGTPCSEGECLDGVCAPVGAFRCTEQGIRDAIAAGGGPHYFACDGPTTVAPKVSVCVCVSVQRQRRRQWQRSAFSASIGPELFQSIHVLEPSQQAAAEGRIPSGDVS